MEWSDWVVGGMLGFAVACVHNLWFRLRKLESENKEQAEKITWLHKRCEKLEARPIAIDYDREREAIRSALANGTLSDQPPSSSF